MKNVLNSEISLKTNNSKSHFSVQCDISLEVQQITLEFEPNQHSAVVFENVDVFDEAQLGSPEYLRSNALDLPWIGNFHIQI